MNPYFSALGWFITSLGWFISFIFFEKKFVYVIFGIITIFISLSFLYHARNMNKGEITGPHDRGRQIP